MRIVLYSPYTYEEPFVVVLEGLARSYARLGHRPLIVAQNDPRRPAPAREPRPWGELVRLDGFTGNPARDGMRQLRPLLGLLRGADLAHIQMTGTWSGSYPAFEAACKLARVPIGATFQDFNTMRLTPEPRWQSSYRRHFLRQCRWVTALTPFLAKELTDANPELVGRLAVIPDGFDPGELAAAPAPPPGRPYALCLAKQIRIKGLDLLLMAWSELGRRADGLDLVIAGVDYLDGHYPALAKMLGVADRVRFPGFQDRARTWELLKGCRFYVQPSRRESFGKAIVEAMACGKAVLATRCGGPEGIIEDGRDGLLVASKDVAALGAGLARLIEDGALREALGRRALDSSSRYRWDRIAREYLALG